MDEPVRESFHDHGDLSARLSQHNFRTPAPESCCDVVLRVDGVRFYAHRFLLAASSKPLRIMLTGSMREAKEMEVTIHDIKSYIMEQLLEFIYTGDVELSTETVVQTMTAAEVYELAALRDVCKHFALRHAKHVFKAQMIEVLPEKLLCDLVAHDDLAIREADLLDAVLAWAEARYDSVAEDVEDTTAHGAGIQLILQDVWPLIRFPTMSVRMLYGTVRPLVRDHFIPEYLLTEALFFHLNWGAAQSPDHQKRMTPRTCSAATRKRKRVSFIQTVSFDTPPERGADEPLP
ncbi:hypothetical protein SPRG_11646 [Saprolegnia parasitica CBS 223.65]|uniref:BTB domain-containing protein n=1 Tax=Saprolegnia parasitica (strain CBS 223.65) TaxID=695850 RepID=A0A067C947_SAPPC|nr:hypothetical protein SPRG_11646 [Saprolegnia parasitica CBS 223.65]KDO23332.1 hypothetical protein SPRG_11646 [Saprolegnia parasitica CBS 223.65]|eukprot:XP_012205984.1 hypothetical protein SPRG_11646 [Saprolegnia parasitica CBS 223.65]